MTEEQHPYNQTGHNTTGNAPDETRNPSVARRLLSIILVVLVIGVAVVIAVWMLKTSPQAKPQPKPRSAALVKVQIVDFASQAVVVSAMGTVVPAREVAFKPQVGGRVTALSEQFMPGGIFRKGQSLLQVDSADYELMIRELKSSVARAEADLLLEQGNQFVAQKEFELLGESVSEEEKTLMLRGPQLQSLQATLDAARAKLALAQLDLARTTVRVPFNAVVQSRDVNLGAQVNEATTLATLVGTDEYWIEVAVPVNQLQWIKIPVGDDGPGSQVKFYDQAAWGNGVFRTGHVVRLAADLEEQGRMARLLVRVADPLGLKPGNGALPRLLIGSFVRVEIDGLELPSVLAIDRTYLRDGNSLWLMDEEDKLDIRKVEIVFRGRDQVLVSGGVEPGERLIVSGLAAAVQGMTLRSQESASEKSGRTEKVQNSGDTAPQGDKG